MALAEALDNASAALTLACECDHASLLVERDALQLKADALAAQGDGDGADAARREAEALARRMISPDLDLEWVHR